MCSSLGRLTICLDAIVANWRQLQQRLFSVNPAGECAAVVKADAYGLGVGPVAQALSGAGCRTFFVATLAEACELRTVLSRCELLEGSVDEHNLIVLGGVSHGVGEEWQRYQLIPVLYDVAHINQWVSYQQSVKKSLPCVIKVDTGMHRLGLSVSEFESVCHSIALGSSLSVLNPLWIMSHLACADDPFHPLNLVQLTQFERVADISRSVFPSVRYSLANSSGIFLEPSYSFDLGRPGAALYGINPTPAKANPMAKVVSLYLPVMQVKTIAEGESVGYGGEFVAVRKTCLAIVFAGYADGLFRCLSHRALGYVGDQSVPLVGRVSMDSVVFDVTDLPFESIEALSEGSAAIELLGEHQTVDDLAACAGTIAYEVLTSLGSRYRRDYVSNA